MLESGASLPDIAVSDDTGASVNLRSYQGRPLVLWFYPKDDTPG